MLQHGYAPKHFMMSTIVPIPKGMTSYLKCSENYRPITINSFLGKVFDKIMISQQHEFHILLMSSVLVLNIMFMTLVKQLMFCYSMHLKHLTECVIMNYLLC